MTVIAIVAQGMMGAGIGARLGEHGAEVRTWLAGRTAASAARARTAGMTAMADERALLGGADLFLSILPPGEALPLARRLAPTLQALATKPVYVDCNAVSPATARQIGETIAAAGARFVDAGIIGGPPQPGRNGPRIYAAGDDLGAVLGLRDLGLDLRPVEGPIGAASALKMSYAGITKGTTALASAMLLGAAEAGCADALLAELGDSQPQLLAQFRAAIPRMYDKAYRWVAEMEEIAAFLAADPAAHDIYAAIARLYDALAAAAADAEPAPGNAVRILDRVLGR
jgi:3-hydroxyisobutyrate dehydrogenase-like beta-hydroxyacid dehydrogenase